MHKPYFIIDFDSTFITLEGLDELAKIAMKQNPNRDEIVSQIQQITKLGMEGKLSFPESLQKRLSLFQPSQKNIDQLIRHLKKSITPSIKRNKTFFQENSSIIYIISGGFIDYIWPVVKNYGIKQSHILANSFTFDKTGLVTGIDKTKPLSQIQGKVKQVKQLKLSGEVIVIGDGITDYEIRQHKCAQKFIAFTENVSREEVIKKADMVVQNFDEILFSLSLPRSISYPKNKMKVLLLENIDKLAAEYFKTQGYTVETLKTALDEKELAEKIQDVSILGIRSKTEITKLVLEHAKKLHAIGAFCIGTNQIDLTTSTKKGVAVFNAPYSNTRSVVELAIGEMILLSRFTFDKSQKLHKGVWDKSANGSHEIRGKKLGIVGYGNIGSQISVLAESLGMEVLFYDIAEKLALGNAKKCLSLSELLKVSDFVTIHVDGREENRNLIGKKEFSQMRDGVVFLNLSRGFIVDIDALTQSIKSGKIKGAAVDVFPQEPKSNDELFKSPLQDLSNVILTPHVAGSTEEAQKNIGEFVSKKLSQFIDTGNTELSVNFPNLQLPEKSGHRFIHIHKNEPGILAQINSVLGKQNINIEGQYLGTTNAIGYVITDVSIGYNSNVIEELKNISGTIKVRVLY